LTRYSNANYQEAYYGDNSSKLTNSVEPLYSVATSYSSVSLSWSSPKGANTEFIALRLVRNQDAYPETEEDGAIIWSWRGEVSLDTSFEDGVQYNEIPLSAGRYVYYTMWLQKMDSSWAEAGTSFTLLPKAHGTAGAPGEQLLTTHDKFMDLLPRMYTSASQSPLDEVDTDSTLYKFLSAMSFTMDEHLTFIDLLLPDASGRYSNPGLLVAQADQFGITQSTSQVSKSEKRMVREALYTYSRKGTLKSLSTLVESVTGFAPTITLSPNLILTNQDSTFHGSTGSWLAVGDCVISHTNTVYPPTSESLAIDMNYTGKVVVATAGAKIVNGEFSPTHYGVPVQPETEYSFTGYVQKSATSGNVTLAIKWHDFNGAVISTSAGTASSATTSWSKKTVTATSPVGAVYASISITFAAAGTYYLDMLQLAVSSVLEFNEARGVRIFLNPKKSNYLENPSFFPTVDTDDTDWMLNGVAPVSGNFVTPTTLTGIYDGSHMLEFTIPNSLTSHSEPGMQPAFYTFSIYAKASGPRPFAVTLSALDATTAAVLATKTETVTVTTSWERYQVTLDASSVPAGFKMSVEFNNTWSSSATINVDAAQLEQSYSATDYFDGNIATAGAVWEGLEDDSPSHLYPGKTVKIPRLVREVYNSLPINTPYSIELYGSEPAIGFTK
jgi:hypothetical protein